MASWVKICEINDVTAGEIKDFSVSGKSIAVTKIGEEFFAFDNVCTHAECNLSGGTMDGQTVICWCHGSEFDVKTGEVKSPPAEKPLPVFKTKIEGQDLLIEI